MGVKEYIPGLAVAGMAGIFTVETVRVTLGTEVLDRATEADGKQYHIIKKQTLPL